MSVAWEVTPYALELFRITEGMLLGSIMLAACYLEGGIDQPDLKECMKLVKPEHFHYEDNARYYRAIQKCDQPDIIGVIYQLHGEGNLKQHDNGILRAMCDSTPTEFDLMHYANLVVELWEKRTGKSRRRKGITA